MSLLLVIIPLTVSIILLIMRPAGARNLALATALANLAVSLFASVGFNGDGSVNHPFSVPWLPQAGISFSLGMDGVSLLLVLLTNLLAPLIVLSSFSRTFDNEPRYYGLVLMMLGALNGVFLAQDGLLFYIFYEMALIPIYFICAIWGGQDRIRVTLKFFIYTFIGSLFMLVALLYVYLQTDVEGQHSFAWSDLVHVQLSPAAANWVMLGFFLAFAVKMPVFPFHTWQPDTYVTSPTGGTMLLAGIMLKMGIYGVIRWMVPLAPEAMHTWTPIFMLLAVVGIVYASIIAVKQSDLKRLIAYSSIAHVGLIAAGVLAWNKAGLQGSLIQMLNHGINVVGLFFIVDLIERRIGTRTLADMGGIAKSAPKFAALFMIVMLGAVAVPLTNGFPGEFLLLNGVWNYNVWLGAVAGLTIIFGAVYMLRAYGLAVFGEANRETAQFQDVNTNEWIVLGVIAGLVVLLGFFPQLVLNLTDGSVNKILGAVQF
ncbi:MAG: NADH-quinone oxidoreductase subunit M [Haliscomenobacteraceae bacterium CHB4]|nr:NADH-quinone oxidoreductase subunit M [Haliscomenobacteraceae bacterium CHB4]